MKRTTPATGAAGDWTTLPLTERGRSRVEASAGTGKTWTISVLYLRLLLERALTPRQIVVTTFTDAAAGELRERLRGRILWALQCAAAGVDGPAGELPAPDEAWLRRRWVAGSGVQAQDVMRLQLALSELDIAPVTTLHGLCLRILAEHPFAAGMPFMLDELVDGQQLVAEVARDLMRRYQQSTGRSGLRTALDHAGGKVDGDWLTRVLGVVLRPGVQLPPPPDALQPPRAYADMQQLAARLHEYAGAPGVLATNSRLRRGWQKLAAWLRDPAQPLPEDLEADLGPVSGDKSPLLKAAQSDTAAQGLVAYTRDVVLPHLAACVHGAWAAVAREGAALLAQRLASSRSLRFDDLILKVHAALHAGPGTTNALADALHAAWPAALVDEFQDTDSQQFEILDRIYRSTEGEPRGRLLMIGDPKQAIYRFRGGDIHAYLRAVGSIDADDALRLAVNHRSSRAMVAAFNQFYAMCGVQLSAYAEPAPIEYQAVEASTRCDARPYAVAGGQVLRPLVLHYLAECPAAVPARRDLALDACASQIVRMLQSGAHRIGGEPLAPSDIAVLLPTNKAVAGLRARLVARQVPCVASSRESVFDTDIARELQVVLHGVAHHGELGALRAAASTRLWGMGYAELRRMGGDPVYWRDLIRQFRGIWLEWQTRGVQSAVDRLIERIRDTTLQSVERERIFTDLRHLGELLQAAAAQLTGPEALLEWLADQRRGDHSVTDEAQDARQLRIESDSARVRLMTLHASKGLEFPVVILPLMWDHVPKAQRDAGIFLRTDPDTGVRHADDSQQARQADLREQQDEGFRVLYVAMTRAIHACHVYCLDPGRMRTANATTGATGTECSPLDVMLARMPHALGSSELHAACPALQWQDQWPGVAADAYAPQAVDVEVARIPRSKPAEPVGPLPAKHSFTTLTRHRREVVLDAEAAAEDEAGSDSADAAAGAGVTSAPASADGAASTMPEPVQHAGGALPHAQLRALAGVAGREFGNAIHAIFEHRLPGVPLAAQRELVLAQLAAQGVRARDTSPETLASALVGRLQAVLDAPLAGIGSPRLGVLAAADLRAEMEFNFSLDGASLPAWRAACAALGEPQLVPDRNSTLCGLMNGKIDLVFRHDGRFHVLDYKGNLLGDTLDDYRGEALVARMDAANYRFQALLYTVAVERYLRQRIAGYSRARDLGDCWYVFVRAAGLRMPDGQACGVWQHRFDDRILDAAQRALSAPAQREQP